MEISAMPQKLPKNTAQEITRSGRKHLGFTIMEVLVATVVLLIGIVGVAKLVPFAIGLNTANRLDSTSLVIAQREMNALTDQPISATTFSDPQGLACPAAGVCNLGASAAQPTLFGSPVVMINNRPYIDYTAATVAGYNFVYSDPDNPSGGSYDVRWAVITSSSGGAVFAKRFIVGVRKQAGGGPLLPVALDSMVEK
jgi:hypothetical protein